MSRSVKEQPYFGFPFESDKQDKSDANRKFRRVIKQKIQKGEDFLPQYRELCDIWNFSSEGKGYYRDVDPKEMRK